MNLSTHLNTQHVEQENITGLEYQLQQKPKPETLGPKSTDRCLIGDYWEYHVILVALKKGAEAYKNVCCTGPIDIVLKIEGEFVPIDVKQKAWSYAKGIWLAPKAANKAGIVWGVAVNPATKQISWYYVSGGNPTWNRPSSIFQCPVGLEGFWDD